MAATYMVKLERREAGKVVEIDYAYASASDDKAGYRKAAKRAAEKLARAGRPGFRAVAVNCVG